MLAYKADAADNLTGGTVSGRGMPAELMNALGISIPSV